MNRFKQIVLRVALALFAVSFSLSGFAGLDDALMVFSTRGPDCYADGSAVQEGEMYALVWMRDGAEFAGFDLNGSVVDATNNALIVAMPLAKYSAKRGGAYCPKTMFQVDADLVKRHVGGTYALALLDTRVADGKGALKPSGSMMDLKGWGLVEKSRVSSVGSGLARALDAGGANGTTTATASAIPAGETVPQPRITGIKVENGFVRLTVKGTSPRLLYNVAAGERPGRRSERHAAKAPQQGHAQADREIELIVPVRENQRFFTVMQN